MARPGVFYQQPHKRLVCYSRTERVYLSAGCTGKTKVREWAWSGLVHQARNMREQYRIPEGFEFFWSGTEKSLDGEVVRL